MLTGVLVVDECFAVISEGIINRFDVDVESGLNIVPRAIGDGVSGLRDGSVVVGSGLKFEGAVLMDGECAFALDDEGLIEGALLSIDGEGFDGEGAIRAGGTF